MNDSFMTHRASADSESAKAANTVAVGTAGFDHGQWQDTFYDAQLPVEWRFLHYSNQFRALLLPARTTAAWLDGGLGELSADSDGGFRVTLEVSGELLADARLDAALASLGPRLQGVVYRCDAAARAGDMRDALRRLAARHPLCIDAAGGVDGAALARSLDVARLWRPPTGAPPAARGELMIARIGDATLAQVRETLEILAAPPVSGMRRGVFFDDPGSAPELARQCRIMAELMGL